MSLSVYKLDGAPGEGAVCVLPRGKHPIGRGPLLQCFDERASRHQALIKVEVESSSIISTHKNPCFYQSAKSKTIIILPENSPVDIQTGDKFGLFPDKCWFKFHFEPEEGGNTAMSEAEASQGEGRLKRSPEPSLEVVESKQPKLTDENNQNSGTCVVPKLKIEQYELVESNTQSSSDEASKCVGEDGTSKSKSDNENVQIKLESDGNDETNVVNGSADGKINGSHGDDHLSTIERLSNIENVQIAQESPESNILNGTVDGERNGEIVNSGHEDVASVASSNANAHDDESIGEKEKQPDSENDKEEKNVQGEEEEDDQHDEPETDGNASASTKREKCWYGSGCYRKNSKHRSQFSHPGDDDYISDPNEDRPTCSYGANCYRRNKDHRKEYKHPGKPADRKRKRKKATPAIKPTARNDESSEDDYDYDDPFFDDGSEDEYEEESWSDCDSDEDSQSASDEEGTMKNLLKEAKRFTRTKK